MADNVVLVSDSYPAHGWRVHRAAKQRQDPANVRRPGLEWLAREMNFCCTVQEPSNAYYVVVEAPLLGHAAASSPYAADRVVRLLYAYDEVERLVVTYSGTLRAFSDDVLRTLANDGGRLRAALAYARAVQRLGLPS